MREHTAVENRVAFPRMCRGQERGALLARRVQATVNGLRKRDQVVVNEELTGAVDRDGSMAVYTIVSA